MPISLVDQTLFRDGRPLLAGVSPRVRAEADPYGRGVFLLAGSEQAASRFGAELGVIPDLSRFTVCYRHEPYWMRPRAGSRLADVPAETQFLIAELAHGLWLLLVPLFGDPFRFSLQGRSDDSLELLGETGDGFTSGHGGLALYVCAGADPYALAREGARSVQERLGSGRLRRDKHLPDFVEDFGWCTWDAFYQEVSGSKLRDGLTSFARGGVSPRLLILDDGWQSVVQRPTGEKRLTSFAANDKFEGGLDATVRWAKEEFGVRTFLCWHAVIGYWGGVDGEKMPEYGVVDQTRQFGEGVLRHSPTFNQQWWGNLVGHVPSTHIERFYDDFHRSLAEQGVDGVKVDSQAVLEAVAQGQGGRVALTRAYRKALEDSVSRHFSKRLINCMSNAQETYYLSPESTLLRTSIDFFPNDLASHGMHLYANAMVGLWFGEFMHPDWDMFQSGHAWGAYHAAARAISGGPVYVSDKPGQHDFDVLRALTCSDGTVLRCDGPGLPTPDVLCRDPTREPVLWKIWNRNGSAAVVGLFHAQTAAGSTDARTFHGAVGPADVPGLDGDEFAVYGYRSRKLERLARGQRRVVSLAHGEYDVFTLAPIDRGFAPIGLVEKINSRAAVRTMVPADRRFELELRDGGEFLAYCVDPPGVVEVDGAPAKFTYEEESCALRVRLEAGRAHCLSLSW